MALDLWEKYDVVKKLFALAGEVLKTDAVGLLRDSSPDELKRTEVAQPSIALAELAACAALRERGVIPVAAAGHSLGEYPALATAGVIDEETCLRLVAQRGKAMAEAVEQTMKEAALLDNTGSGMAAVIGLPPETVEGLVAAWTEEGLAGLYAANLNSARQTVVSGTQAALNEAGARFKAAGAKRFVPLAVGGPFHSPLMRGATERFEAALAPVSFADPVCPFFSNVTGKQDIEAGIAALGVDAVLEAGPGKTLCGLWKDSGSAVPCYAAGSEMEIQKISDKR